MGIALGVEVEIGVLEVELGGRFQALFIEVSDDFGVGHFLDRLFGAMSVEKCRTHH